MDAFYKHGWTKFTCPACTDSKQVIPSDLVSKSKEIAIQALSGAAAMQGKLVKCSTCSEDLNLLLDTKSAFTPRVATT